MVQQVFVVDPAAVGDNTGTVIIKGNLQVDGATTTINSTTLTVDDLNITLASGAANGTAANGAGITVDGASATLTYQSTGDNWAFNKNLDVTGNIVVSGTVDGVDIAARDAVLTSTTTTAGAALPKAGGTMTGTLLVTAGNGDQLQLNNAGERFTQISLQHSGTQNGALWLDDTDSMVDLYANTSHGIRLKTGGDNPRVTILANGNVGIGTDSPQSKFAVSNGGAEGFEVFPGSASGQNSFQHYNRSGSAYLRNRNIASEFTFNLSGASEDAVIFKSDGKVAINHGLGGGAINSQFNVFADGEALRLDGTANTSRTLRFRNAGTNGSSNAIIASDGILQIKTGDANAHIYVNSVRDIAMQTTSLNGTAGHFTFSSYNTEIMRIDGANNRVGIGTDSPIAPLHVEGNAVIETGSPDLYFATTSASHYNWRVAAQETVDAGFEIASGTTSAGSNAVNDTYTTHFVVKSSGNVGIGTGTSTPNRLLEIAGNNNGGAKANYIRITDTDTSATKDNQAGGIEFFTNDSVAGIAASMEVIYAGSGGGGEFTFNTAAHSSAGVVEAMRINENGNVGIGTSTPSRALEINTDGTQQLRLTRTDSTINGNNTIGTIEFVGTDDTSGTIGATIVAHASSTWGGGSYPTDLRFSTMTGSTLSEAMRIDASGNVEVKNGGSLRAYRSGNSAYAGLFMDTAENLFIRNSYSTKDIVMTREGQTKMPGPIQTTTDSGTRMFTGLATGSFYHSYGFLILRTNIPAHNASGNANMFSLSIEGFGYSNSAYGIIDMNIGCYSGENNYYNASYSGSNIPNPWINNIYFAKHDSSGTLSVIIGTSSMSIPAEIACTKFIQGYVNVNEDYANGWDWITTTSVGDYSQLVKVQPKNTKNPRFAASTNTGFSVSSGSWQKISDSLSENADTAGVYDGTSGRFTPTMEGHYQFNFGGYSSYNSSTGQERYALAFAKNGTLQYIFGGNYSNADSPLVGGSQSIYLDNNDWVELWCYSSVTATWAHSSHKVWWEGYWTGS